MALIGTCRSLYAILTETITANLKTVNQDPKTNPNSYPDPDANPNQPAVFRREGKQK